MSDVRTPTELRIIKASTSILALVLLLVSACGLSQDPDEASGPATSISTTSTVAPASTNDPAIAGQPEADRLDPDLTAAELSQCLRDEGLDVPDFRVDAQGHLIDEDITLNVDPFDPLTEPAFAACEELFLAISGPAPDLGVQEPLDGFSQCVRDGGYDVPDLDSDDLIIALADRDLSSDNGDSNRAEFDSDVLFLADLLGVDATDDVALITIDDCATTFVDGILSTMSG